MPTTWTTTSEAKRVRAADPTQDQVRKYEALAGHSPPEREARPANLPETEMTATRRTIGAAETLWGLGPLTATSPTIPDREKYRLAYNGYQQLRGALQMVRFGTDDYYLLRWLAEAALCLSQHFANGNGPTYFIAWGDSPAISMEPGARRFLIGVDLPNGEKALS